MSGPVSSLQPPGGSAGEPRTALAFSGRPCPIGDLRRIAEAASPGLWAILDCCDSPAIQAKTAELEQTGQAVSLYLGQAAVHLREVAPFLVKVDAPLLKWIIEAVWSEPWGIFFTSEADMEALRRHLRGFLLATGPGGSRLYFRFYDPRVLSIALERNIGGHAAALAACMESVFLPTADPGTLKAFKRGHLAREAKWGS